MFEIGIAIEVIESHHIFLSNTFLEYLKFFIRGGGGMTLVNSRCFEPESCETRVRRGRSADKEPLFSKEGEEIARVV